MLGRRTSQESGDLPQTGLDTLRGRRYESRSTYAWPCGQVFLCDSNDMKVWKGCCSQYPLFVITAILGAVLLGCGTSASPTQLPTSDPTVATLPTVTPSPQETLSYFPVTIESCASTTGSDAEVEVGSISFTYQTPPQRAVSLNQHATEVMLALGLEDNMVGTAYIDDEILPEYLDAYSTVPVLADDYPSKEVILSVEPDFIYGGFSSAFGIEAAGDQENLKSLGIGSYLTMAICQTSPDTLEDVYTDLRSVGSIFGVSDRAESVVLSMEEGIDQIKTALGTIEEPLRVFLYDSGDDAPFTSVCCSMFTALSELAGADNIFDDVPGRWKTVNWEEVIARDPEVIVLTDAVWSSAQEKLDLLNNTAAFADITAVKNQRFVVLKFSSLVPGIRNPGAARSLAEGFYPERFN